VLKNPAMDDGGNKGQKRKRVRKAKTAAQKTKYNETARNAYARKKKELQGNPNALKEWRNMQYRANRKILYNADPVSMAARKSKNNEASARYRLRKNTRLEANPDKMETERKKVAEQTARAKTKRLAEFEANPGAETAWKLKQKNGM
jgi:hypothetical protein